MALVPMPEEAKNRSYYKYYAQGIAPLTPAELDVVEHARRDGKKGLPVTEINRVLEPGTICPEESGYYFLEDGSVLTANQIPMPGVTPEMLYWWFAWHPLDPLRYAIWDPEEHYDVKINELGKQRALDPAVPLEEKTWGADHTVLESLAPDDEPMPIDICFRDPAEMGIDPSLIGGEGCEFIVTANALAGGKIPSVMLEIAKRIDGTLYFMVRFWAGYHMIDGRPVKLLPEDMEIPEFFPKMLFGHSTKEFRNLAKILPQVFAEEAGKEFPVG